MHVGGLDMNYSGLQFSWNQAHCLLSWWGYQLTKTVQNGGPQGISEIRVISIISNSCTVDDSGVGQRHLNVTGSRTILKLSEYHEFECLGLK